MDARKFAGFAMGPIVSGILGVITLPVMAWTFSPADIGRLSMLQLLTSLGVITFSLGMDQSYGREYHDVNDHVRPRLLIAALLPGLLLFLMAAAVILLFAPTLPASLAFHTSSGVWSFGLLSAVAVALMTRFLSVVLRMREQGFAFSLSQSLPKLLFLFVVLFAWAFDSSSFDLLLGANVATLMVVFLAYAYYTRTAWIPGLLAAFDWVAMRRMLHFGGPLVLGGIASWAAMTLDKVLLQRLSTLDELGLYAVATSVASAVGVATVMFTTVWVPTVYKWHAQGDAWPRVQAASQHAIAACSLAIAAAGILSPAVSLVLPGRYVMVPMLIPACMTLPVFSALSEATAIGLGLGRKTLYSMLASLCGAVSGFTAGIFLIPELGARGASVAAVVASAVFVIARTEFAHRAWRPVERLHIYTPVAALALLAGAYAISGMDTIGYWTAGWCAVLLAAVWLYRQSLQFAITSVRQLLRKRGATEDAR